MRTVVADRSASVMTQELVSGFRTVDRQEPEALAKRQLVFLPVLGADVAPVAGDVAGQGLLDILNGEAKKSVGGCDPVIPAFFAPFVERSVGRTLQRYGEEAGTGEGRQARAPAIRGLGKAVRWLACRGRLSNAPAPPLSASSITLQSSGCGISSPMTSS